LENEYQLRDALDRAVILLDTVVERFNVIGISRSRFRCSSAA